MKSGVRKSGWPMPRLMMSRPWAISALARASTAKAFSSPMRSKAAIVFSMALSPNVLRPLLTVAGVPASTGVAADPEFRHPQHLEDDGDRPSDQKQAVQRGDRDVEAFIAGGQRVAVAERGVVLERELENTDWRGCDSPGRVEHRPHRDLDEVRAHQHGRGDQQKSAHAP